MFMAIGLSQYNVALFHMVNHAFFKALLFLGAGAVIHAMGDQQDIRRLGGLIKFLPFTYTAILIGSLSLMALPWLTGFYSKDLIIELAYAQYQFSGRVAYWLGTITAVFTAFYSFRLISLVFLSYPNAPKSDYLHTHEASTAVIIPLTILALFSIFFGFVFSDLFVGIGTDFFGNSLFTHPDHITLVEAEFSLGLGYKLLPSIGSVLAAGLALVLYNHSPRGLIDLTSAPISKVSFGLNTPRIEKNQISGSLARRIYTFLNGKYLFDVIYNKYLIGAGLNAGYSINKYLDKGAIEFLGPYGLSNILSNTSLSIGKLDTGIVTSYALYMVLGLISILFIVFYPLIVSGVFSSVDAINPLNLLEGQSSNEIRLIMIFAASLVLLNTQSK
jgi:NADH-ubiquinone oxidoreductase chain 5